MLPFVLLCTIPTAFAIGRTQSVVVKGKLMCDNQPASGVYVKMYDGGMIWDTFLGEAHTDSNGEYTIMGSTSEVSTIDPHVNIYHDCNDFLPCQRKLRFEVPDSYISSGEHASKVYNMGVMQLSGKWKGESRDCIHRRA